MPVSGGELSDFVVVVNHRSKLLPKGADKLLYHVGINQIFYIH